MQTVIKLKNEAEIKQIIADMVEATVREVAGEQVLLCLECCDVDLYIASESNLDFQEAIRKNFTLDEYGDVEDIETYNKLMAQLDEYYVEQHKKSKHFDFFPAGEYEVDGEIMESETDVLAPKGVFYAPFEEAVIDGDGETAD